MFKPAKLVVEGWNGYVREKGKVKICRPHDKLRSIINSLIILEKLGMKKKYVIEKVTVE